MSWHFAYPFGLCAGLLLNLPRTLDAANFSKLEHQARLFTDYMDKILCGVKPGAIPASSAACGYGSAGSAMNQRRFIASTSLGEHGEKADRCLYQGKRL
jgi:hypothetical protein